MKRDADEIRELVSDAADAEVPDALYELHKKGIAARRARVASYVNGPCPSPPLEAVDELLVEMGKQLETAQLLDTFSFNFTFWSADGRIALSSFSSKLWHAGIRLWDEDVETRRHFVQCNGTGEQVKDFKVNMWNSRDELRSAISKGWNKLHPNLPGHWNDKGSKFLVMYVE